MAEIRNGLTSYLNETALHGFKYIGLSNVKLLKFLWVPNKVNELEFKASKLIYFIFFLLGYNHFH